MLVDVLIADRHETARVRLRTILERQPGFSVVGEATTVEDSMHQALLLRPQIVLMDVPSWGATGIDACEQIIERLPHTDVIIFTACAEDQLFFPTIATGASGYVLKDVSDQDLIRVLETVGSGQVLLDPALTKRVFEWVREAVEERSLDAFAGLTEQEMRVLALVAEGMTNREIAQALYIGEGMVRNRVGSIFRKLDLANRTETAAYAVQHGIEDLV